MSITFDVSLVLDYYHLFLYLEIGYILPSAAVHLSYTVLSALPCLPMTCAPPSPLHSRWEDNKGSSKSERGSGADGGGGFGIGGREREGTVFRF